MYGTGSCAGQDKGKAQRTHGNQLIKRAFAVDVRTQILPTLPTLRVRDRFVCGTGSCAGQVRVRDRLPLQRAGPKLGRA
ncbi:MAG: hypothetical protein WCI04_05915 [archaeon]